MIWEDDVGNSRLSGLEGESLYDLLEAHPPPKWMLLELNMRSTLSALKLCADFMSQDPLIPLDKRDRFQLLFKTIEQAEEECWPIT